MQHHSTFYHPPYPQVQVPHYQPAPHMFRRRFGFFPRVFWVRISWDQPEANQSSLALDSQPQNGTAVERRKRLSRAVNHVRGATADLCAVQMHYPTHSNTLHNPQ